METLAVELLLCNLPQLMKRFLLLLMAAVTIPVAHGAISVGPTGSGTLTFNTTPLATEFSTAVLNGTGTTYATPAELDAGANTLEASSIVSTLPTSGTLPPSTFSGGFRHNNNAAGLWIQSRPTTANTNAANVLLATLQNDSGDAISSITISYTFGINNPATEEAPGFRVFYSLSGAAGRIDSNAPVRLAGFAVSGTSVGRRRGHTVRRGRRRWRR